MKVPRPVPRALRLVRSFGIVALFLAAAFFGIASGVLFAFVGDLPQISALDDYSPSTITRVLGRNGAVVGEFASERRQIVTYEQIPPVLRNAIISAEDKNFLRHSGLSVKVRKTKGRKIDAACGQLRMTLRREALSVERTEDSPSPQRTTLNASTPQRLNV